MNDTPLSAELLGRMNAWWRAANYLPVGQIYLLDNPLLKRPLVLEDVKPRLLGHWRTTPGLNFVYVHLNRAIKQYNLDVTYVTGPGHGGPAFVASTYLERTYSEIYPEVTQDEAGSRNSSGNSPFRVALPATRRRRRRVRSTKAVSSAIR